MAFLLRKLLSDYDEDEYPLDCSSVCADDSSKACPSSCFSVCPKICYSQNLTTYLNPPPSSHQTFAISHKSTLLLVSLLSVVFIACLLAFFSALRRRSYSRRVRSPPRPPDSYDEFVDEEEGPILDHPIWYIRTVGLQPSVISAITICKYKRSDGLIEGTGCSVCLTEFEEDESLRLLPKCNHAFHLPCIDTWLQSRTSCPLCRAPVSTVAPSPELGPVSSGQAGEMQLGNSQNVGALSNREEEGDEEEQEEGDEEEEEEEGDDLALDEDRRKRSGKNCEGGGGGVQMVRRSVSLDSRSDQPCSSPCLSRSKTGVRSD